MELRADNSELGFRNKLITYEQCKVLFDEYSSTNYAYINEKRDNDEIDSRSYWYSLQDLKDYLNYVETEAAKNGHTNLGIRIYMGKYPKEGFEVDKLNPEYKGYQTIFMVATSNDQESTEESVGYNKDITSLFGFDFSQLQPPPAREGNKMLDGN